MTPKEKAIDLVDRFKKYAHSNPLHESELFYRRLKENAKQCALIAVDELIESHLVLTTTHDLKPSVRCKRYWQEVKQEIETL